MGMHTILYGCIVEMDLWRRDTQIFTNVRKHNKSIIRSLPMGDSWPPLSREMFSFTENAIEESPDFEYGGRVIHFAGNFKGIEEDWNGWKEKFDKLLTQLYWMSAYVHLKTEYSNLWSYEWQLNLCDYKYNAREDASKMPPLIQPSDWEFNKVM